MARGDDEEEETPLPAGAGRAGGRRLRGERRAVPLAGLALRVLLLHEPAAPAHRLPAPHRDGRLPGLARRLLRLRAGKRRSPGPGPRHPRSPAGSSATGALRRAEPSRAGQGGCGAGAAAPAEGSWGAAAGPGQHPPPLPKLCSPTVRGDAGAAAGRLVGRKRESTSASSLIHLIPWRCSLPAGSFAGLASSVLEIAAQKCGPYQDLWSRFDGKEAGAAPCLPPPPIS